MISKVAVFHRGGAVLWRSDDENETQTPTAGGDNNNNNDSYLSINKLIQTVLLSDKTASDHMIYDSFTLKWTFANNLDLVFVAVYFSFQKSVMLYVDDFLQTVKNEFINMFKETLKNGILNLTQQDYTQFYLKYKRIQKYYKTQYKSSKLNAPKQWHQTKQGQKQQKYSYNHKKNNKNNKEQKTNEITVTKNKSSGPRPFNASKKSKSYKNINKNNKKKKNKKQLKKEHWSANNVYNFKNKKVSKQQMDTLNFALEEFENEPENEQEEEEIYDTPSGQANFEESSSDESSDDDYSDLLIHNKTASNNTTSGGSGSGNSIWNKFSKLIGNKPIDESDLIGILKDLENQLSTKNVANSIAKELCDSLGKQLIGKRIGTFESIKTFVKNKMNECLERILQPEININILHDISIAKKENRPYSIVFIGVNGVGKSTSLSKLIYYLKSRNLKVSVAACDTFRSGAVEQLKTHCKALKVRLFSQGYARDSSSVAYRAIQEATNKYNDDVILIDTAGRMQNNAPLMKSLVSLITRNKPDLILFVGEALVGNDGVDQLLEFNKALKINQNKHLIDAIILTKFDTVDDKVGAAISMTYKSRKPIIFIGTGQHYPDLKRMHVKTLINKLLK